MSSKPAPQSSFVLLWEGENPALHDALLEELQLSGIPYWDKPIGEAEVAPTADPLPIDWKPRFGFEVSVPSSDATAAKQILERLLDEGELADVELPANDELPTNNVRAGEQEKPATQVDEPAIVSVWAGNGDRIVDFLTAAMRENDIPIELDNSGGQTLIYVSPSNATRAREIVREVTEAAPPE